MNGIGGGIYATAETNDMGKGAENLFALLCKKNNKSFRYASKYENCIQHFDFHVKNFDHLLHSKDSLHSNSLHSSKVEVKSIKCRYRGGPLDPTIMYIEIVAVDGNPGWIMGEADYIAFEQPQSTFLCVSRKELMEKSLLIAKDAPYGKKSGIKGTLWTRTDRQDLILCLDRKDVLSLPSVFYFK